MEFKFPKKNAEKLVNTLDAIGIRNLTFNDVELIFDKQGVVLIDKTNNEKGFIVTYFDWVEKCTGFKNKYHFSNSVSKWYSILKDAIEKNIEITVNINGENESNQDIYANGILIASKPRITNGIYSRNTCSQENSFVRMNKSDFVKNFSFLYDFTLSMDWNNKTWSGVSFFFKNSEVYKTVFSPSCFVIDNMLGQVNHSRLNTDYKHNNGHFILPKNIYNLIDSNSDEKSNILFNYSYRFEVDEDNSENQYTSFIFTIDNDYYIFNVVSRAMHLLRYDEYRRKMETEGQTFVINRDTFNEIMSKIVRFKEFEKDNVYLNFTSNIVELWDGNDSIITKVSNQSKEKRKESIKIGVNAYVFQRILKHIEEAATITMTLISEKDGEEESKYFVIENDKDKKTFVIPVL